MHKTVWSLLLTPRRNARSYPSPGLKDVPSPSLWSTFLALLRLHSLSDCTCYLIRIATNPSFPEHNIIDAIIVNAGTSISWRTRVPGDTAISFSILDAQGTVATSAIVTVRNSTSDFCL
ncbi:hypothetical protein C8Q76DRAFT_708669 [Earliella scabrosa]|nr:hypothetical protein C8Q76DRAFT_708669 [Earliella scabrosa]